MNFNDTQLIALGIRIVAELIMVFLVIPRVWRESRIKDGLFNLRLLILWAIICYFSIGLALIHMNFCNVTGCTSINATGKVAIIQAFAFLNVNFVLYMIYHQKYKKGVK
jgi:hypothetical protein